MSTPADAATDNPGEAGKAASQDGHEAVPFEQQVEQAVANMTKTDDGKYVLPEDLPDEVQFAANVERRRRDTQSALAKERSTAAALQAEKEELVNLVKQSKAVELTPEEQTELDELKFSDPDEWRKKVNELERSVADTVNTKLTEISSTAKAKGSLGEREVLLAAFLEDNPELTINDDVIANDIPPRITKALENGEVSFMQFLGNVKDYLTAGKVIKDTPANGDPNLTNVGGGATPSKAAQAQEDANNYEDSIF